MPGLRLDRRRYRHNPDWHCGDQNVAVSADRARFWAPVTAKPDSDGLLRGVIARGSMSCGPAEASEL